MLTSLLTALYRYPVRGLLIFGGVALLAPVIFPVASFLIRPLVKPVTAFYLDLAEEATVAIEEREHERARKEKGVKYKKESDLNKAWEKTAILDEIMETL
jgi:hypothetical protein